MTRVFAERLAGKEQDAAARAAVIAGTQSVLIICSGTAERLSSTSRELVRELRSTGTRTEFHVPGDADTLLQSTNRLLADIPLDSLLSSATRHPPHLLVIDDAERLSAAEVSSLRRLINGLRGSAFRVLLLVRHAAQGLRVLPLAELAELTVVWDVDGTPAEQDQPLPGPDRMTAALELPAVSTGPTLQGKVEPSRAEPPRAEKARAATPMNTAAESSDTAAADNNARLRDVLAELANERAAERGFDVTAPRRGVSMPVKAVVALSAVLIGGYLAYDFWLRDFQAGPLVYDCGLHADRETVDVLLAQVGRTTPTRVLEESGRFRVQVGPFAGRAAADAAREQVWRLGACRVSPVTAQAVKSPAKKAGG